MNPGDKTEAGQQTFNDGLWPDVRVKKDVPPNDTPNPESIEEIVAAFKPLQGRMEEWAPRLAQINHASKVEHGWFGWLTAAEWFDMIGMHNRQHLRQLARLEALLPDPPRTD